jgi:hypothetical protein
MNKRLLVAALLLLGLGGCVVAPGYHVPVHPHFYRWGYWR